MDLLCLSRDFAHLLRVAKLNGSPGIHLYQFHYTNHSGQRLIHHAFLIILRDYKLIKTLS